MTEVTLVPILSDNYCYIVQSKDQCAVVDPGEAGPVIEKLDALNLKPDLIFNTHHHGDHIAGNDAIREKYGAKLVAPDSETKRIHNIDTTLKEGETFEFGDETIQIFETPGHTTGHICFWLPKSKILFSGDLLFALGCGRAFEGTASDLYHSLAKVKSLPPETKVYCGHEYTLDNAKFCLTIEADNQDLQSRYEEIKKLRSENTPTIPTTLEEELKTNAFLRANDVETFADIRSKKDNF